MNTKLYIEQIDENKFHVTCGAQNGIMTTEEVVKLLTAERTVVEEKSFQEQLEEFWASKPIYPRM